MKDQFKVFVSGFLTILLLLGLIGNAVAANRQEQAVLNFSGIKITLDGKEVVPKDANGTTVEPFAINGTTYLPVRAVGNAMGLGVDWDQSSNTVLLKTKGETSRPSDEPMKPSAPRSVNATLNYSNIKITLDGTPVMPKDTNGNVIEPFSLDGTTYLPVRGIASALGLTVEWEQNTQTVRLTKKGAVQSPEPVVTPKPTPVPTPVPTTPTVQPDKNRTIYITPTGKRYHYDGNCNGGTYIKSTLEEAIRRGLTPCKKCVG